MPKPLRMLLKAIGDRLSGAKPGVLRTFVIAAGVGMASAVLTYRLLRRGD